MEESYVKYAGTKKFIDYNGVILSWTTCMILKEFYGLYEDNMLGLKTIYKTPYIIEKDKEEIYGHIIMDIQVDPTDPNYILIGDFGIYDSHGKEYSYEYLSVETCRLILLEDNDITRHFNTVTEIMINFINARGLEPHVAFHAICGLCAYLRKCRISQRDLYTLFNVANFLYRRPRVENTVENLEFKAFSILRDAILRGGP